MLADHPEQTAAAIAIIGSGVYIPLTVLLELGWLLTSRYRQSREVVAAALLNLIDLPSVQVAEVAIVRWALGRFGDGGDFADMLHLVAARDATAFATFDRGVAIAAGPDSPVAVETL
nr:type II toxin-antitoxin system VapC family toxin [Sphingomonas sp. CFBP 13720]